MNKYITDAINYHNQGFNCCQSILLSYSHLFNIDKKNLLKLSEGFGLGISGKYSFCGALSAVIIINSYLLADGKMVGGTSKHHTYEENLKLINKFEETIGSVNCLDIKGINTNKPLCSCNDAITEACKIINELIKC